MVARHECVDVEALADANIGRLIEEPRFGFSEILQRGHLHIGGVAIEYVRPRTSPLGDRGVVSQPFDSLSRCAAMRVEDQIKTKALRRLHGAQGRAQRSRDDKAAIVDFLDGVAELRPRRGGAVSAAAAMARSTSGFDGKARAPSWMSTRSGA